MTDKLQWKKGTFNARYMNSERETQGYVSELFGIRKVGKAGYSVTHLKTGYRPCDKYFKTIKAAKIACEGYLNLVPFEAWKTENPYETLNYSPEFEGAMALKKKNGGALMSDPLTDKLQQLSMLSPEEQIAFLQVLFTQKER